MYEINSSLQSLFPQLDIYDISPLGFGNDSIAVLMNNQIVFKIPKHKKASNNLAREKQILDLIKGKITLPIPNPLYYAVLPNGFNVIGYNKIEGKPLTSKEFATLTNQQKGNLARQIAKFLKELHQIKVPNSHDFFTDNTIQLETNYKTFMEKFSKYLSLQQVETAKKFFKSIISDESLKTYKPVLIHNDFSASNILFDETTKTLSGIIDFGDVAIADRDNDFLCLLENSDEEYGREFGIKVLKYYGLCAEEIELAIKKTDIKKELWPYEEILLSDEYNDKSMLESGLKKLRG